MAGSTPLFRWSLRMSKTMRTRLGWLTELKVLWYWGIWSWWCHDVVVVVDDDDDDHDISWWWSSYHDHDHDHDHDMMIMIMIYHGESWYIMVNHDISWWSWIMMMMMMMMVMHCLSSLLFGAKPQAFAIYIYIYIYIYSSPHHFGWSHWYKLMVNGITFMTLRHHTFDGWIIKFHGQIMLNPPFSNEIRRCWRFNPHWLDVVNPHLFRQENTSSRVLLGEWSGSPRRSRNPTAGTSATPDKVGCLRPFTATWWLWVLFGDWLKPITYPYLGE